MLHILLLLLKLFPNIRFFSEVGTNLRDASSYHCLVVHFLWCCDWLRYMNQDSNDRLFPEVRCIICVVCSRYFGVNRRVCKILCAACCTNWLYLVTYCAVGLCTCTTTHPEWGGSDHGVGMGHRDLFRSIFSLPYYQFFPNFVHLLSSLFGSCCKCWGQLSSMSGIFFTAILNETSFLCSVKTNKKLFLMRV